MPLHFVTVSVATGVELVNVLRCRSGICREKVPEVTRRSQVGVRHYERTVRAGCDLCQGADRQFLQEAWCVRCSWSPSQRLYRRMQ